MELCEEEGRYYILFQARELEFDVSLYTRVALEFEAPRWSVAMAEKGRVGGLGRGGEGWVVPFGMVVFETVVKWGLRCVLSTGGEGRRPR